MSDEGASDGAGGGTGEPVPAQLLDVRFVGPATAPVLEDADIEAADIVRKRVSYRQLTEAGVNPGVASRIRREHSLPWSFDSSADDLEQRSSQIRGLDDGERAWIAASSGDWEDRSPSSDATEADGSGDDVEAEAAWRERTAQESAPDTGDLDDESAWRERSAPEPVTTLDGIDEETAAQLANAGITSVRRLSTVDPDRVSAALAADREQLRRWRDAAVDHLD